MEATTAAGNKYEAAEYVDPYPGRKGDEILKDTCGKCRGDQVIHWGNITLAANGVSGRVCFQCMGKGYTTRKVSSARSTARRQVAADNARRAEAADWAAEAPAREAREAAEAAEAEAAEAKAEADRIAAMTQGFAGEEGERLRNIECEVITNYQYEATSFNGYSTELRSILVLRATETGKTLKWATGAVHAEKGERLTITGTVKAHANYKGQDQTVLTRCKISR